MPEADRRLEHDSMGTVAVPASALWGAQTQRVLDRPALGTRPMPPAFIRALALEKWAAARSNAALGELAPATAQAIATAALSIAAGEIPDKVDVSKEFDTRFNGVVTKAQAG